MHEAAEAALNEKLVTFKEDPKSAEGTIKSIHFEQARRKVIPSVSVKVPVQLPFWL